MVTFHPIGDCWNLPGMILRVTEKNKIKKLPNRKLFAERAMAMPELAVEFNPYDGLVPIGLVSDYLIQITLFSFSQ